MKINLVFFQVFPIFRSSHETSDILTMTKSADNTKQLIEIAAELNISREHIVDVCQYDSFLSFRVNGVEYTNKLTKNGKHKKNSVRRA